MGGHREILFSLILVSLGVLPPVSSPGRAICRFAPESGERIPADSGSDSGVSRREYEEVVDSALRAFEPVFARSGLRLTVLADWDDPRAEASATRDDDDHPIVKVSGGMARHPEMTRDGLALVLCHELGHFLGGAPKATRGSSGRRSWSSVEGQADYFAAAKCMKTLLETEKDGPGAVDRIVRAGESAARVFAALQGAARLPDSGRSDPHRVSRTLSDHPAAQCRLDTFRAGALCRVPHREEFSDDDPKAGACSAAEPGARPACWFSEA